MKWILKHILPRAAQNFLQDSVRAKRLLIRLSGIENKLTGSLGQDFDLIYDPIFIIASPRTGSTLLYQAMCKYLDITYFCNLAEEFPNTPTLSYLLSKPILDMESGYLSCNNRYGITEGLAGPAEASLIFGNWFPYLHPSETLSKEFHSREAMEHMVSVFRFIQHCAQMPLITKNAWNCFRLPALSRAFPHARYVYLERDLVDSSYSLLQARKIHGNPSKIWNSATPAIYKELQKQSAHAQVVEQQVLTNRAVHDFFDGGGKYTNVFRIKYDSFVADPVMTLERLSKFCCVAPSRSLTGLEQEVVRPALQSNSEEPDRRLIKEYCDVHGYL